MKTESKRLRRISSSYNSLHDFDRHLIEYSGRTFLQNIRKTDRVLELGCASGVMTPFLGRAARQLTVVDGSPQYIRQAQRRAKGKNTKFIVSLFEEFHSEDSFDVVVMASILEHVKKPVQILTHMRRYLAPKGKMLITVPNAHSLHRQIGKSLGLIRSLKEFSPRDYQLGHRRIYDRVMLVKDVRAAGLKIHYFGGIFLKPFSNLQMETFSKPMLEEFYRRGNEFPGLCNYLYVIASR